MRTDSLCIGATTNQNRILNQYYDSGRGDVSSVRFFSTCAFLFEHDYGNAFAAGSCKTMSVNRSSVAHEPFPHTLELSRGWCDLLLSERSASKNSKLIWQSFSPDPRPARPCKEVVVSCEAGKPSHK